MYHHANGGGGVTRTSTHRVHDQQTNWFGLWNATGVHRSRSEKLNDHIVSNIVCRKHVASDRSGDWPISPHICRHCRVLVVSNVLAIAMTHIWVKMSSNGISPSPSGFFEKLAHSCSPHFWHFFAAAFLSSTQFRAPLTVFSLSQWLAKQLPHSVHGEVWVSHTRYISEMSLGSSQWTGGRGGQNWCRQTKCGQTIERANSMRFVQWFVQYFCTFAYSSPSHLQLCFAW